MLSRACVDGGLSQLCGVPILDGELSMRGIVMAKIIVLTLLGLYLVIGLTHPTGQGAPTNRIAVAAGHSSTLIEPNSSSGRVGLSATCNPGATVSTDITPPRALDVDPLLRTRRGAATSRL
jgi:hypothetical protein